MTGPRTDELEQTAYFGDLRDYWWNLDHLELCAKRLGLDAVRSVLDVGAGVGHWGRLLGHVLPPDATVVGIDREPRWIEEATRRAVEAGVGDRYSYQQTSAEALPFEDASFDLVTCQTVLIHVADPRKVIREMVRVTKPGGLVFLSYTLWYGPWGGHETAPWHFLGGHRAARRYEKKHGHPPKNVFGTSLFPITAAAGLRWARRQSAAEVLALIPRYLPRWAWWVLRVPVMRELATWNLAIVLRKT
jgi:SAM-dependent methyltransferase